MAQRLTKAQMVERHERELRMLKEEHQQELYELRVELVEKHENELHILNALHEQMLETKNQEINQLEGRLEEARGALDRLHELIVDNV